MRNYLTECCPLRGGQDVSLGIDSIADVKALQDLAPSLHRDLQPIPTTRQALEDRVTDRLTIGIIQLPCLDCCFAQPIIVELPVARSVTLQQILSMSA